MKRNPFLSTKTGRSSSAFTLLEVLITSAILAVLIILVVGIADGASRIWRDGERRRETVREARAGLEIITEDLHSAVLTTNPATLIIQQEGEKGEGNRLFLLVAHPHEKREPSNEGDLCASGYFIARDPADGTQNLYRFHASGNEVATAFEHGLLKELYATASSVNTQTTELLARHVIRLDVRRIPETTSASSSGLLMLSLSAIGGEAARLLISDPRTTQDRERNERLLRQHLHRYSTFVALPPERDLHPGL